MHALLTRTIPTIMFWIVCLIAVLVWTAPTVNVAY